MLTRELTAISAAQLPFYEARAHMRLPDGFDEIPGQMAQLETALRAAISMVETRLGKMLLSREFVLSVRDWSAPDRHVLPFAPISAILGVTLVRGNGQTESLEAGSFRILPDRHRPLFVARRGLLPLLSGELMAEVQVAAGYGTSFDKVPAPIRQAVLMLAEGFMHGKCERTALPQAVAMMIEPYRARRLSGLGVRPSAGGAVSCVN